ncbi:MAG: hypothetical protein KA791_14230 [Flavobacteriales bacterium]|nr:hypothetical protein [Flavobacteriales bacterium]
MKNTRLFVAIILAVGMRATVAGQAGTLDPNFSADGYTSIDFAEGDVTGFASARTSSGDIYVGGTLTLPQQGTVLPERRQFAIVRMNEDGSLDNTFSGNGRLLGEYTTSGFPWSMIRSMALQPDGKIVVVGEAATSAIVGTTTTVGTNRFGIARYNSDGTPDTEFSSDGFATVSFITDAECRPWDVAIQSDGKIVVAGWTNVTDDDDSETNFAVVRLNENGSVDNTFSSDGKVQVDFGSYDSYAHAVAIQGDGKIVLAGTFDFSDGDSKIVVARLNANGILDNTFSGDGKYQHTALTSTIDNAWDVMIDPDDRIVVGGEWSNSNGTGYIQPLMFRLATTGVLDPGFSVDGEFAFEAPQGHGGGLRELEFQCDGKILAAGYSADTDDDDDMLLARITSTGSLDNSFSSDGMALLGFGIGNDVARSLTVRESDQFITVAGAATVDDDVVTFGVARFRAESGIVPPAPVITFDPDSCELSASGSGTFNWQNELFPLIWTPYATGNPVSVAAADDYSVRVTAASGCESPWSAPFELEGPCSLAEDCLGVAGGTANPGTPCDDNNTQTGNDTWSGTCDCVGEIIDCVGVIGGDSLPGTPCDDGSASTANDVWSTSCVCVGSDCQGVANGPASPGTPCDDGAVNTGNDTWTNDCDCVGEPIDCLGVIGGAALPGTPCDDQNAETINDTWIIGCTCIGLPTGINDIGAFISQVSVHPNPLQDVVTITCSLREATELTIALRDMTGRKVGTLLTGSKMPAGEQRRTLQMPTGLASGNYLLVLSSPQGRMAVRVSK